MRAPSAAFRRYVLLEAPGWALAACVAWALVEHAGLTPGWAVTLVAVWVAKDFALYPWLRHAYEPTDPDPSAGLAGRRARVTSRLDPEGYVQLGSERWKARVSEGTAAVEMGAEVRVLGVDGLTLRVEPPDSHTRGEEM